MEEKKKERHYTKHLKEQRMWSEFICDTFVPQFVSNISEIKVIADKYLSLRAERAELDKENWMKLHNIVEGLVDLMEKSDQPALVAFDRKYFISKYHEKHSGFYHVEADRYMQYMLNHIDAASKYDPSASEKDKQRYVNEMYTASQHLFFFTTTREKLGLSD